MVTVGCPRIVLKMEPDPLTIPPPIFHLLRFGLRDYLIYRAEQSFIFRLIQSPSLVPAKTGSAGVYRKMRVESSGGSPTRHDPPRTGSVRGRWKSGGSKRAPIVMEGYSFSFAPLAVRRPHRHPSLIGRRTSKYILSSLSMRAVATRFEKSPVSFWTSPGFVDTGSGNNEGPEEVSISSKRYTPEFRAEAIRQGRLKPAL
jgi:hypothetical protein